MKSYQKTFFRNSSIGAISAGRNSVGIAASLLAGIPIFASAASAAPSNPCPRIYYEEPYNSQLRVPAGCPPNAASQQPGRVELPSRVTPAQFPLPEQRQSASARVIPTNGAVDIQLINTMNIPVTYQVIADTAQRSLPARGQATLQDLPVPITVTFVRLDNGLVRVVPRVTAPGSLEITLSEAASVGASSAALRVQRDGSVFLN